MNPINSDFRKYYLENRRLVFYSAYKILRNRDAADDVTSDVFLRLYKQMLIRQLPEDKIRPWLTISAKRRAYNYIRDHRRLVPLDPDTPECDLTSRTDDRIFVSDMLERLHRHNTRWFDTVVDFYLLGLRASEIAEQNKCSEQAVRNILQRARDFLRSEYPS